MRRPTDEELDRAAALVARVASIPGLENGGVVMAADSLDRVERWQEERGWNYDPATEISVELPLPHEREDRLHVAARRKVLSALGERQDELADGVQFCGSSEDEEKRARAAELAALLYDEEVPA